MLQELFKSRMSENPIFEGDFNDANDVFNQFCVPQGEQENIVILYASYECEYYEGYASVYFFNRKDEKFYEVYGSHCSCYGLEDQWQPEEICFPELEKRFNGNFFGNRY